MESRIMKEYTFTKRAMYEAELWFNAWLAAIQAGKAPWQATDIATKCIEEFTKRFLKKEETE